MKRTLFFASLLWFVAATAWPLDQIYTSTSERVQPGTILSMTPTVISFKPMRPDGPSEFNVNEVKRIIFDNSPQALTSAQTYMLHGEYDKAIDALKNEVVEGKRQEVADEITFIRAYCASQMTLSGEEDLRVAGPQMIAFTKNCPNSFHYYKACETVGDLLVSAGNFAAAQEYYGKLTQAPWPDYKIRAQVALGRAYLAQDNAKAADKAFDDALANDSPGELAEVQRTAAKIGKVRCMALTGKADLALSNLNEIMDKLDDKNAEISAMAYNALGTVLRKTGKPREAILAFLHVHLIYDMLPDAHAEAVANLAALFTETHNAGHARDMQSILAERYKNSRWAKPGAVK